MEKHGCHFVQASDEFYLTAELPIPEEERYDGYLQLENGVGMIRLLKTEFMDALEEAKKNPQNTCYPSQKVTLATGKLAAPLLMELAEAFMEAYPQYEVVVAPIRNDFFGERITVSGLITAQDLVAQLKDKDLGGRLLLPTNMLRMGEDVFLDDWTVPQLSQALGAPVQVVGIDGFDLCDAVFGL